MTRVKIYVLTIYRFRLHMSLVIPNQPQTGKKYCKVLRD